MTEASKTKKVFISYSWSSPAHEDWVLSLAQRLVGEGGGVDVILDKWNLKEGHDKYAFMEQMVQAEDIDKVLMICDKTYAEKANNRAGGVGTETVIISPKIYQNVKQEKFIAIVKELDENGKAYLPHYLESRLYIDMSSEDYMEESFEKLLRNIYERPSTSKPKLGAPPKYIFEDTPITYLTTTLLKGFNGILDKNPDRVNSYVRDFFEKFLADLKLFQIDLKTNDSVEYGKEVINTISQYTPLRNDYIQFLDKLSKSGYNFEIDILISFFETITSLTEPDESTTNYRDVQYAHFKYIIYELFLYTVGISIKNENYKFLECLFHLRYFRNQRYRQEPLGDNFTIFNYHIDVFDGYYKQLHENRNFFSPQADFTIKRIPENHTKALIIEADLLCNYIGQLKNSSWFPRTYVYKSEYDYSIGFLGKLVSKRYFEKIKNVLDIDTVDELKDKISKLSEQPEHFRGYPGSFSNLPSIKNAIDFEKIGIFR